MLKTDEALQNLNNELQQIAKKKEDNDLESKKNAHKIAQFHKDHKEAKVVVDKMEKDHPWIPKEKAFFGRTGTDFDFEKMDYKSSKERLDRISDEQRTLGKSVNKRVMSMFEKADAEYKDLLKKRDIIMSDKKKIEEVLEDLDQKKLEAVRTTWVKVNKDFGSIFSTLLPGANSKLEPPEGWTETEGLEIKVAFGDVWKQSLSELSGGQRSLLALSLVQALLEMLRTGQSGAQALPPRESSPEFGLSQRKLLLLNRSSFCSTEPKFCLTSEGVLDPPPRLLKNRATTSASSRVDGD